MVFNIKYAKVQIDKSKPENKGSMELASPTENKLPSLHQQSLGSVQCKTKMTDFGERIGKKSHLSIFTFSNN